MYLVDVLLLNMTSPLPTVTLLIKNCPDTLVDVIVKSIETFGFERSLLVAPLNVALDHCQASLKTAPDKKNVSSNVIYMKTNDDTAAVHTLKGFVEQELNTAHNTSMYCIEVKPRNYPVHFTLLFAHAKGAPAQEEMQELFAPFGKCTVRIKDHQMTYINFPRFEQIVAVLQTLRSARLYFRDMVVLMDELVPVQNAKLMVSFEALLVDRFASILKSKCITKHNLTSWFNVAKQNENCDKTWEQLVDFVSECIARKFGWAYNVDREMFCEHRMRHKIGTAVPVPGRKAQNIVAGIMSVASSSVKSAWSKKQELVHANTKKEFLAVSSAKIHSGEKTEDILSAKGGITSAVVCQIKDESVDMASMIEGHVVTGTNTKIPDTNAQKTDEDADWQELTQNQSIDDEEALAHMKINLIPLYGDEESHPLHQKLCSLERQLFGKSEENSTSIHYRIYNMEMMMNINNETQPTCVRISQLSYWIQQYCVVVGHVAAVDTGGGLWELKVV